MNQDLFRPEVMQARSRSWLGDVSLAQPLRLWGLAAFLLVAALAVMAVLFLGEYTRRATVTGQLVPDLGLSTVLAPAQGVVARQFSDEGERVRAGQPLTLINVPRSTAAGDDALAVVRAGMGERSDSLADLARLQAEQVDTQIAGARRQLAGVRRELVQIEAEIATRREQVRIGRETTERFERISDQQYISQVQVNQQKQAVLDLVTTQQQLERQATALRRSADQLEQSLRELPAQRDALAAALRRDRAELDLERVQREADGELLLKAPVSGLVTSRLVESGQAVQVGQPLMSVMPAGSELQAQLWVPSHAVGFIRPGDRVLLRYRAYPHQKFGHHGGRILRLSRSAAAVPGVDEPMYRAVVALDAQSVLAFGRREPLRPGMALEADILGERRRLYEWLLEPLYALRGRIGG
jgi:membrane fusion protein